MEHHFYRIRLAPLSVTIFITHVRILRNGRYANAFHTFYIDVICFYTKYICLNLHGRLFPNFYVYWSQIITREGVYDMHWRSSHYAVTHVRIKDSKFKGRSSNVVKLSVHTLGNR